MPPVESEARTRAQQHYPNGRVIQNFQQPQSSHSEPSNLPIATSQRQDSDNTTPHSSYDAIRKDDRQRYEAGERPGPNWKDAEAMKAWLEQRFPQGTEAGSPYYQFMIVASRFEDTYWTPGRGSEAVVSKFSESEWKRWTKEKAGLVMYSSWGQDPLYPDAKRVKAQAAFGDTAGSSSSSQPLKEEGHSQMADVDRFLDGIENTRVPSARVSARMEGHLDGKSHGLEKSHSSSKRTVADAELDAQEPSAWKRLKRLNAAKLSHIVQSIPESDSSSKKRTASDAETDADESPRAKRVKRCSGTTSPFQTTNSHSNSLNTRRDKTTKNITYAPRSMSPPPLETEEAETLKHNSQSEIRSFGNHDAVVAEYIQRLNSRMLADQEEEEEEEEEQEEEEEEEEEKGEGEEEDDHDVNDNSQSEFRSFGNHDAVVAEYIQRLNSRMLAGQEEEAEEADEEEEEDDYDVNDEADEEHQSNTAPALPPKTPHPAQTSTTSTSISTTPRKTQHFISVLIPAPSKTPLKKRLPASLPPPSQTRYLLRSSVKKRGHTLPHFVHLGIKNRKEIQIAGCFGF